MKPKYQKGDILWVRETFTRDSNGEYIYRADPVFDGCGKGDFAWTWASPIFMPREASRITLKVKNIRIEKLVEITEDDAKAEGLQGKVEFLDYWDELNKKRGFGVNDDPFVYCVSFMRIK
jgi:hypothetical protein